MSMIQYLPFQSAYLDGMTEIIYQVWDMERLCGSAELGARNGSQIFMRLF